MFITLGITAKHSPMSSPFHVGRDGSTDVVAFQVGQQEVQQDQIRGVRLGGFDAALSGTRGFHAIAGLGQRQLDQLADSRAVIDDEYGLS
jgi:hypothetical protein